MSLALNMTWYAMGTAFASWSIARHEAKYNGASEWRKLYEWYTRDTPSGCAGIALFGLLAAALIAFVVARSDEDTVLGYIVALLLVGLAGLNVYRALRDWRHAN
jgi:hypothetical protein